MGTTKFPNENELDKYLSAAGGHSNAYTQLELTCYYLDCQSSSLEGAIERFASCFAHPLLSESSLEREINAIDSEHAKNVSSDHWRLDALSRTMLGRYSSLSTIPPSTATPNNHNDNDQQPPQHPYAGFGSGNKESLAAHDLLTLRNAVQEFWQRHYCANNLTVAVLSNVTLDELEQLVRLHFVNVPSKSVAASVTEESTHVPLPLAPPLPALVHVQPMRDQPTLELQFPMREIQSLYESKPSRFVSHLLGHEGPGSLLMCLREHHWAQELVADDMSKSCHDFSVFSVEIELTPKGLEHVHSVVALVFAYLDLLRNNENDGGGGGGVPSWVFDELRATSDLQFRFLSDRPPSDTVASLVDAMHHYPPHRTLSGPHKLFVDQHPHNHIQEILKCLTPSNVLILLTYKEAETNQTDPWYGTPYREVPVDDTIRRAWESPPPELAQRLRLPDPNDMLPTNFDLVSITEPFVNDPLPRCILDTDTCRLWYKPDTVFSQPKVNVLVVLRTPAAYADSPLASVLAALWVECVQEHAKDFSYAASMAGLHCEFSNSRAGLEIHLSGYSHKVSTLLERILVAVETFPAAVTEDVFERVVEKARNQFAAFLVAQPYQHAIYAADLCLEDSKWGWPERRSALDEATRDDLLYFASRVLERLAIEALVHGNLTGRQALDDVVQRLVKRWEPLPLLHRPAVRVAQLQHKCAVHRFRGWNETDSNSCVLNVYQVGAVDVIDNAKLSLLQHLLREPAFNRLRTEEQLGYIVHTALKTSGDIIKGWLCLIQSDSFDPIHMDQRIESFLQAYRSQLVSMSEDDFATNVESVCQNLLEADKNLGEESIKHWSVISNQTYRFTRLPEIAACVRTLTKPDVLRFFDRYLLAESPFRRKLSVQVFGKNHAESLSEPLQEAETAVSRRRCGATDEAVMEIQDPVEFRNSLSLFPASETVSIADRRLDLDTPRVDADDVVGGIVA